MRSLQTLLRNCSANCNLRHKQFNNAYINNKIQSHHQHCKSGSWAYYTRQITTSITSSTQQSLKDDIQATTIPPPDINDTYAVAIITPNSDNKNIKLSTQKLSIQQIVEQLPGTHARDFFSLSLTSLGDASRKRKMIRQHYSVRNSIHPWFILPRESEIVMSFGCVRAIINQESAMIFDAHKPTIKQQAMRISDQLMRKDRFAFRDGEIIFHNHNGKNGKQTNKTPFEIDMVEQCIASVCTMYSRRIRYV